MLIVVTGPSGSGKSTILRHVMRDLRGVRFSVSHTTRHRRPSEKDGKDYHFVDRAEFERMVRRNAFVEWAVVHGHLYGTSKREIADAGKHGDVILDIDVQGARQVQALGLDAVFAFIMPPAFRELKRRLAERGEDKPEVIERRLKTARREIKDYTRFDYVVINDRLDRAVLELESIILSARCRLVARKARVAAILRSFGA
jgi:guanylate kinase